MHFDPPKVTPKTVKSVDNDVPQNSQNILNIVPAPIAQVVERPLLDREVAGSILGRAIPKA